MVDFDPLTSYLRRVPAVGEAIGTGDEEERWWCKFSLDIGHPLAWRVVQELGHVLNYLSLEERPPTVFKGGFRGPWISCRNGRMMTTTTALPDDDRLEDGSGIVLRDRRAREPGALLSIY